MSEPLLRQGRRAPEDVVAWTSRCLLWAERRRFEYDAQQVTLLDYLHAVEHAAERIVRLERAVHGTGHRCLSAGAW